MVFASWSLSWWRIHQTFRAALTGDPCRELALLVSTKNAEQLSLAFLKVVVVMSRICIQEALQTDASIDRRDP